MADPLVIAGTTFTSRLIAGTARFPNQQVMLDALAASGAEMVTAILSGQVQMAFPDISILLPLIREGKLKALAVTSAARHPQLPDVPTMGESGIADFVMTFWSGVMAPADTPASVVERLNTAINDGLKSQAVRHSLENG